MKRLSLSLLILLSLAGSISGQPKSIVGKKYPERYRAVGELYRRALQNADSTVAFQEANQLIKLASEQGDKDLELETELLKLYYFTTWYPKERDKIEQEFQRLIDKASTVNDVQIQTRAHKVLGDYYWFSLNNYELAFETYMRQEQLLHKVSSRDLPDKVFHLQNMAQAYHNFSDYEKARHLYHQIVSLEVDNDPRGGYNSALYAIGKIHRQLSEVDSSDYYYRKILGNENTVNYPVWRGIAHGGLGLNQFLRGNYDAAIPYLDSEVELALKEKDYGLAAGSLITLADIYLKKNDLQKAERNALFARSCLSKAEPDRYKHYQDLYPVLSKLYSAKGMPSLVGAYLDSAMFAKDSITRQFNSMQMMRARQKIELQEHRAEIEKMDAEKRLKALQANMLIFVVVVILLLSAFFIYYQRQRHREKQAQMAREVKIKEDELASATRQLREFARNISEKSKLIEQLEQQQGPDMAVLTQLRERTILTPEEWSYFKKLFDKVHVGYLHRLRQKFPDLTQSEIRFIALIKLELGYQEMSSILGVSNHAVRTTKYRLLKKISLPTDKSLEEVLTTI